MLDQEDIEEIIRKVKKVKTIFQEEKIKIDTINLESVNNIDEKITYIDSSYVSGIVGPISYIYSRAVAISNEDEIRVKDFIIIPDILIEIFEEGKRKIVDISSIASLISKNLEYKLLDRVKEGYVVLDGSLISDFILYKKFDSSPIEEINNAILEFKEKLLNSDKARVLSVAKRILHSRLLSDTKPDFIILLNSFPYEPFCTKIFRRQIEDKYIKALYIRSRAFDHIYRVESWDSLSDEEILAVTKEMFNKVSYPLGLKLAHNLSKIRNKEKNFIEDIIKNILGAEKSINWDTK